jgi:hypothetical protein
MNIFHSRSQFPEFMRKETFRASSDTNREEDLVISIIHSEETICLSPTSSAPDSSQKFASRTRKIQIKLMEIFAVDRLT